MAEITIIPLLNAQQQSMAEMAVTSQTRPEMAQEAGRQIALDTLRQEAQQIQKPEETAKSNLVGEEDDESEGNGSASGHSRNRKRRPQEGDPGEEAASSSNPLLGNLLNVKI